MKIVVIVAILFFGIHASFTGSLIGGAIGGAIGSQTKKVVVAAPAPDPDSGVTIYSLGENEWENNYYDFSCGKVVTVSYEVKGCTNVQHKQWRSVDEWIAFVSGRTIAGYTTTSGNGNITFKVRFACTQ